MIRSFDDHSDRPLYRWKLLENGEVTKIGPITMYTVNGSYKKGLRYNFLYPDKKQRGYCAGSDIDVFSHGRVYSFNEDDQRALNIIRHALTTKCNCLQTELQYAQEVLSRFTNKN